MFIQITNQNGIKKMKDLNTKAKELATYYGIDWIEKPNASTLINSQSQSSDIHFSNEILNYFGLSNPKSYSINFSNLHTLFNATTNVMVRENVNFENANNSTTEDTFPLAA